MKYLLLEPKVKAIAPNMALMKWVGYPSPEGTVKDNWLQSISRCGGGSFRFNHPCILVQDVFFYGPGITVAGFDLVITKD